MNEGLPVAGYRPQSDENVRVVNTNKELEERVLRQKELEERVLRLKELEERVLRQKELEERVLRQKELEERVLRQIDAVMRAAPEVGWDPRWAALARTHIEQGFMALNRAIFRPERIKLPGE